MQPQLKRLIADKYQNCDYGRYLSGLLVHSS